MEKIPVAILGASGTVGQRLVSILYKHPWFEPVALCASERSVGKPYAEAVKWKLQTPIPLAAANKTVQSCLPVQEAVLAFSALDADVAYDIEESWAKSGKLVVSNTKCHRMRSNIPLIIPELNASHLSLISKQVYPAGGAIVTNPNCSTIGLAMALKPLHDAFGIKAASVVTMQAASGAGYPGVSFMDLLDNVIPYIPGEEEKLESEPKKILGQLAEDGASIKFADFAMSAACHRVPVMNGHLEAVSVLLEKKANKEEIIEAWLAMDADTDGLKLPSSPRRPLAYDDKPERPQPRYDRMAGNGMTVSIGRLRPCAILGWKFELLSHNTLRGGAGGTVLLAELCVAKGLLSAKVPAKSAELMLI
ncbi:aspartate-semialdehyde dehydrogenase [Spirochaetota bacterium]